MNKYESSLNYVLDKIDDVENAIYECSEIENKNGHKLLKLVQALRKEVNNEEK